MIRLRDEAASTSPPPSQLPSVSHREDRPEVSLPPRKRVEDSLARADHSPTGISDSLAGTGRHFTGTY
uniref:Uncharacterized protein n=1 Tax=Tanacetum cinerariifolium TaxID=118510 RepID=A0A699S709_TANCI|nr:hypothetical protein [Tanacetum cinerariifolium]